MTRWKIQSPIARTQTSESPAQPEAVPIPPAEQTVIPLERVHQVESRVAEVEALIRSGFEKIDQIAMVAAAEKQRGQERDNTISRLLWELEDARKRAAQAEAQRDTLSQSIGELRGELKAAQREIEHSRTDQGRRLEGLKTEITTLQGQVDYLTKERKEAADMAFMAMSRVYFLRAEIRRLGGDPDMVDPEGDRRQASPEGQALATAGPEPAHE